MDKEYPKYIPGEDLIRTARILYFRTSFPSDSITDIVPVATHPDRLRDDEMFRLEYKWEEPVKKEKVKPERITELQVLDYGEYSVAVFGPAWNSASDLKSLGGRYNKYLTHPHSKNKAAGWIFRKNQLEQVKQLLRLP